MKLQMTDRPVCSGYVAVCVDENHMALPQAIDIRISMLRLAPQCFAFTSLYYMGCSIYRMAGKFGREFILALKVSRPPAKKANRHVVPHHVTDNETVALRESTIASGYPHSGSACVRPIYNPSAGGTIEGSSDTGRTDQSHRFPLSSC